MISNHHTPAIGVHFQPPRLRRDSLADRARAWFVPATLIALVVAVAGGTVFVASKADASDVDVKIQRVTEEHRDDWRGIDHRLDSLEQGQATQTEILMRLENKIDSMRPSRRRKR